MTISKNESHAAEALLLLTDMFKGRPILEALLTAKINRTQEAEEVLYDVLTKRPFDDAEGAQLDLYGFFLNLERTGRSDDDFREVIRVEIAVLNSNGGVADIYNIMTLLFGDTGWTFEDPNNIAASVSFYSFYEIAYFRVTAYNTTAAKAKALSTAMRRARSAGVGVGVFTSTWPAEETFRYGSTTAPGAGTGFSSTTGGVVSKKVDVRRY